MMLLLPNTLPQGLQWLQRASDVGLERWPVWWPTCRLAIRHAPRLLLQHKMQQVRAYPPNLHVPRRPATFYGEAGWIGGN